MLVLLLNFIFITWAWAADSTTATVEQAQAAAVKKDRGEACAILRKALEGGAKGNPKLLESLQSLSKVFFTDKGQKIFEAGQSMMFDSPDVALNQFRSALELEDNNIQILTAMARLYLSRQDCDSAARFLTRARTLNPVNAEAAILELRSQQCAKKSDAFRETLKKLPALDKWESGFVQYVQSQEYIQQGQFKRAWDLLTKVIEEHPQFPETYFYLARAGRELKRDVEPWQQKYVSLCKGITHRERKKFALEPRLCASLKEVEDDLAKYENEI